MTMTSLHIFQKNVGNDINEEIDGFGTEFRSATDCVRMHHNEHERVMGQIG